MSAPKPIVSNCKAKMLKVCKRDDCSASIEHALNVDDGRLTGEVQKDFWLKARTHA